MLNGAAVITDTCSYVGKNYKDNMLFYNKSHLKESIGLLKDTLNNTQKLYNMASGLEAAACNETWEDRCRRIIEFVTDINR